MTIKNKTLLLIAGSFALSAPAIAENLSETAKLKETIEQLDQQIKILARKQEIATAEAADQKKSAPVVNASDKGLGFKSAEGQFEAKLRGLVQFDYRDFSASAFPTAVNGFTARRIRPTLEGTVFGIYGFRITPEFGENKSAVVDAYGDVRLDPGFQIRVGKFKPFVGLERLQSGADIKFIERSYVSNNILPNRDLGISVFGDVLDKKLSYAVGVFNGVADGSENTTAQDTNSDKEYAARLFTTPFAGGDSVLDGLGFGIAGTTGTSTGTSLSSYKTPGQANSFFNYATAATNSGTRTRWSPQAYFYRGSLGLIAEYAASEQEVTLSTSKANLKSDAWQLAASYLLTGEDAAFKGVKPNSPFKSGKDGGWGALELVARYQQNHIDKDAVAFRNTDKAYALSAQSWAVGLNWYLNQSSKLAFNYEQTDFGDATAGTTLTNKTEKFAVLRYQLAF